jgi:hypothetical protein
MIDSVNELIEELTETPEVLKARLADRDDVQPRSVEDWGPVEIVAHIEETDEVVAFDMIDDTGDMFAAGQRVGVPGEAGRNASYAINCPAPWGKERSAPPRLAIHSANAHLPSRAPGRRLRRSSPGLPD